MNTNKLIVIALAALLVTAGGAAAMPGQAPNDPGSDAADDQQPDEPDSDSDDVADENATDDDGNATQAEDGRDENATDAPPTDMPEQAPDHVSQIHQLIREKLNGTFGNQTLGEAISGVVGSNGDAQADAASEQSDSADDRSANANEAGQSDAGPSHSLPEQAADHVSSIHDAIMSFLNGDGDGNPGGEVSSAASG